MRTFLMTLAFVALLAGAALAADANPPLLSEGGGYCPPPPPVCPAPPPPVCEPPPPVCAPPPPVCEPEPVYCEVPVKSVVNEVRTVTVKKKVWEDECYVAEEKQTEVVNEVRTRTASRTVQVIEPKMVSEAKIITTKPNYGSAPRLARGVNRKIVPVTVNRTEQYEETYIQPVRHTVSVPVVKSRKVAREVEEEQTITVPVTVTTMETRRIR